MNDSTGYEEILQDEALFDPATVVREAIDEIYIIDARNGHFLYANDAALKNTGYTVEELRKLTPLDLQQDIDLPLAMSRIEPLRRGTEKVVTFETTARRKDGSEYLAENSVQLLRDHTPPVFVARARVISERTLPSSAVLERHTELLYRHLIESTVDGVWAIDAEGVTVFVNQTMATMLGYAKDEMIGVPLFEFMDEAGKATTKLNLQRRRQGISERHDFKLVRKDGSEIWAIVAAQPVTDGDGQYSGAVAVITDITERTLRERALLNTLHASTPDELWGASLPAADKPVVRMPEVTGLRAARVAKRFSVLADAKRLELIELLASGEQRTVNALAEALHMTASNVSKHLKVLAEGGIVSRRQDGTRIYYTLEDPTVAILCRIVCQWLNNQAQAESKSLAG